MSKNLKKKIDKHGKDLKIKKMLNVVAHHPAIPDHNFNIRNVIQRKKETNKQKIGWNEN